ncbi:MAG: ATP-binding protein, partial [Bacteroidales bacterium]|nr:ATP-binding protein [Bacteroidales bacterium]
MKRKIYNELLNWKRERKGKSALLIEGARRIGKSFIVEEFARNEYDSYILIDFNNVEKSVIDIFEKYTSQLDMFFQLLSLHFNVQLVNRNSLIIFDEVQQYPPARAVIKYLVADGRYDYIETGSLINIRKNVQNIVIPSEEHHLNMFPMDFEEFLWAMEQKQLFSFMQDCFIKRQALGPLHQKAMDLFRLYMTIGGMPQVVQEYINTKDFRQAELIKQDILSLYKNDIHKYATGAEAKAANIFEAIPSQLQKQGTHFTLTDIDENARYTNYASSFFWLADSRIVNICYNTFAPNIGLGMNTERTTLKCYLGDTGLLISMAFNENNMVPAEIYERLIHGKLEVNLGIIVENIVAQILRANGHTL